MINGSACRLKDINELFYDTGIGKEGYSIIGQGQIDKILSGKPEERRELFDEAAGIVKFKRRKAIAQKKLEDEKQNLVRVSDILAELEKQVGPLERQSKAAREYLQLKEELKTYDVNLFLMESEGIRSQLEALEEKEEVVSGDLAERKQAVRALKERYEELEADRWESGGEITAEAGPGCPRPTMLKGNLEGQINVLNEQINTEQMNAEHIQSPHGRHRKGIWRKSRTRSHVLREDNAGIIQAAEESRKRQEQAEAELSIWMNRLMLLDAAD